MRRVPAPSCAKKVALSLLPWRNGYSPLWVQENRTGSGNDLVQWVEAYRVTLNELIARQLLFADNQNPCFTMISVFIDPRCRVVAPGRYRSLFCIRGPTAVSEGVRSLARQVVIRRSIVVDWVSTARPVHKSLVSRLSPISQATQIHLTASEQFVSLLLEPGRIAKHELHGHTLRSSATPNL